MNYVICDIDGTLADCGHRLHHLEKKPKDWDAFYDACAHDPLVWHVAEIVRMLSPVYDVVYVSGRPERLREKTVNWLLQYGLAMTLLDENNRWLYMRKDGDFRPDELVKREIWEQTIRDKHGPRPLMAIEDRPRIVRLWKALGIPVVQVGRACGEGGDF